MHTDTSLQKPDVPIRHLIVYKEPGRFCGWPAANGIIWSWENEILVAFTLGYYEAHDEENEEEHSIDRDRPSENVMARSLDGGESWNLEKPKAIAVMGPTIDTKGIASQGGAEPIPCPGGINFTHPDFALTCRVAKFYVSYDRGKTWERPYALPDFGGKTLTAQTDYIVENQGSCLFFLSAFEPKVEAGLQNRAFCARTGDGGKTFDFLSWITPEPLSIRSFVPSSIRCSETQLISAVRRRVDKDNKERNWISVYLSNDSGESWEFLSKVADTGRGKYNGNPPSMVRLTDGRICVTYGYRATPYGMRAKLSEDNGKTWGDEIILRQDARTWDFGYSRTTQRPDGKIVTVYYYTTEENPEQHIAATIWDADRVN